MFLWKCNVFPILIVNINCDAFLSSWGWVCRLGHSVLQGLEEKQNWRWRSTQICMALCLSSRHCKWFPVLFLLVYIWNFEKVQLVSMGFSPSQLNGSPKLGSPKLNWIELNCHLATPITIQRTTYCLLGVYKFGVVCVVYATLDDWFTDNAQMQLSIVVGAEHKSIEFVRKLSSEQIVGLVLLFLCWSWVGKPFHVRNLRLSPIPPLVFR